MPVIKWLTDQQAHMYKFVGADGLEHVQMGMAGLSMGVEVCADTQIYIYIE